MFIYEIFHGYRDALNILLWYSIYVCIGGPWRKIWGGGGGKNEIFKIFYGKIEKLLTF